MTTVWEITAHPVNYMFSLYYNGLFVSWFVAQFGFDGGL